MVRRGRLSEAVVAANVLDEVASGRRVGPKRRQSPSPDAYFHLPDELEAEAAEAGLRPDGVFGVQGAAWLVGDDRLEEQIDDPEAFARLLAAARLIERMMPAMSAHLLLVARRPSGLSTDPTSIA